MLDATTWSAVDGTICLISLSLMSCSLELISSGGPIGYTGWAVAHTKYKFYM
jgi:hypothetical protein